MSPVHSAIPMTLLALLLSSLPDAGRAEPMDLGDSRPRWVSVRFEVSPPDQPGQRDVLWSDALPAWLEPGERAGQLRVSVPARLVESRLFAGHGVVPGSFADFVWIFDVRSGDVLSATTRGTLRRRVGLGFVRMDTDVHVDVALSTLQSAGFHAARRVLGQDIHELCTSAADGECRLVRPERYDARRGTVNAVGALEARATFGHRRSFCPLGEAAFAEWDAPRFPRTALPAVAAGPP